MIVEIYITPSKNRGDETVGPTSVTHKSEGLRGILEAETPVRKGFPRNILQESSSDIPNDFFNNLNHNYSNNWAFLCFTLAYTINLSSKNA